MAAAPQHRRTSPTTSTPWGRGRVVARAGVEQSADDREFATIVEVVELGTGERVVRVAYSTDGVARRGPVTLRARDLARLTTLVRRNPTLLGTLTDATRRRGSAGGSKGVTRTAE